MMMRDKNACDRCPGQRPVQRRRPCSPAAPGIHAGVDQCPAVIVAQGVDIHVVERHGQRQAQPQNAGRDLDRRTGVRRGIEGIPDHAARSSGDSE
jgi:hypothetical protein